MAILPIRKVGDPVLRSESQPVTQITEKTRDLLDNMAETMYQAPGIGLAAPQVGVLKRIIVVDVDDSGLIELINPEIVEASEEKNIIEEACLSVPGQRGDVIRASRITVKGLGRNGAEIIIKAQEMLARTLQHEIDHLDGVLFLDRVVSF